jgi:hypothetical protein
MARNLKRRTFMASAAASGTFAIVPRHVLGGAGYVPPSDKITLAHIGVGTEGLRELGGLLGNPEIQVVAVADPNKDSNDYVEWGQNQVRDAIRRLMGNATWRDNATGCPGGREVGREAINAYYTTQRAVANFKGCSAYADFRELLEKEKDIDAVKIMTPDHLHATVAIAAMKKGKHVLMHKPIANRLYEARLAIDTARKTRVSTHFLAWSSGDAVRSAAAMIKDGAIGPLRAIHNWSSGPIWPVYPTVPTDTPPIPKDFDWDLWLGPALDRPYHPNYTHGVFRGWYDFGGGYVADTGHYSLIPVFTEFNLSAPISVETCAGHTCSIVGRVSHPVRNDAAFPAACIMRFKFAARDGMPPLDLFWYEGSLRPPTPPELEEEGRELPGGGMMFVGDKGKILGGINGQGPQILPKQRMAQFQAEQKPAAQGARRGQGGPGGGDRQWVAAIKGGPQSPGSFLNMGAISDAVNLGAVALRARRKILFDSESMKITNVAEANKYLYREYRKGWEL